MAPPPAVKPRAVYVIGGAGTGKSTFMATLLSRLGVELGPLEDLAEARNSRGSRIVLRGQRWPGGVYLGVMRPEFPGTDGLDRVSSLAGLAWVAGGELPSMIVGEGLTLAHKGFLTALGEVSELLVVHLTATPEEVARRCVERGSSQQVSFLKGTVVRAANLAAYLGNTLPADPDSWDLVLDLAALAVQEVTGYTDLVGSDRSHEPEEKPCHTSLSS